VVSLFGLLEILGSEIISAFMEKKKRKKERKKKEVMVTFESIE
jgi:putative Mn2+ efflux pump MntP